MRKLKSSGWNHLYAIGKCWSFNSASVPAFKQRSHVAACLLVCLHACVFAVQRVKKALRRSSQPSVNWIQIVSISPVKKHHKASQARSSRGIETPIHKAEMKPRVSPVQPSFQPSCLRACYGVVERVAGQVTSDNGFIYKLVDAGGRLARHKKMKERWRWNHEELRTSLKILNRVETFSPGSHPGYQAEVIMLWSTNEFIS